ncbi:hypothetical protein PAT3040_01822 [Paenibacillus agaridevorans]|uniref:Xylose isomerase-like TIM barrel domain-containing protein n=1 Tax=Paenibacillus agaridevorans TaxID=171404 RepID=A0A2R5EV72_9BACL|nr:TIM barrel protein [Paenibacillus agaridevorans]GBG07274.1 hypothetical protein PAT3040_01822 [Paenibacillus agaridevorans]
MGDLKDRSTSYIRVFTVEPENHIEYKRRFAKAVTRSDLGNKIHFSAMRAMELDDEGAIKDFNQQLDLYTKHYKLGEILWLFYKFLYASNLNSFIDEVKDRGLYIFDIWGYVPGSFSNRSSWGEYEVPEQAAAYLRKSLGSKFMGFDNGEQDGRYIGAYTPMICPVDSNRKSQYLHFQRHFEQLGNHFDNQTSVVCSLTFCHYFAKEGNAIIIGAETAQALPNANIWYSYLRGAGKQYGLLWFGNASIWNRFGYKDYERAGVENGYEFGPDAGTSLSLLRRLIYIEYMYNCDILGLEWGFTMPDSEDDTGTKLTPIGQIQTEAVQFVANNGYPGIMYTPAAVLMDFFNGWTPPRHLYTHEYYKVWGNLPYEEGDYQTHALFTMLFPGYENSGFYRDERGFLTATPYGDMTDVIFSDADQQILNSYHTIILAGKVTLDVELYDKLRGFVEGGGHLIATADVILSAQLPQEYVNQVLDFVGIKKLGELQAYTSDETIQFRSKDFEEKAFEAYSIEPNDGVEIVARLSDTGTPFIVCNALKQGKVSFIASPFGLNMNKLQECKLEERETKYLVGEDIVTEKIMTAADNVDGKDLPMYYDFLSTVKQYLGSCLNEMKMVEITNRSLQCIVNTCEDGSFLAAIVNNSSSTQMFDFVSNKYGFSIESELPIPALPEDLIGYYAKEFQHEENAEEGSGSMAIKPADIRIFRLKASEWTFQTQEVSFPADSTKGKFLAIRNISSLKTELLTKPTFKHHFQGVKLDASYFIEKDMEWLRQEASSIRRYKVEVIIDFSSMLNHYPQLSLLNNIKDRYEEGRKSIALTFEKAALLGCKRAIFILHRNAENHITVEDAVEQMAASLKGICADAAKYGITIYLQNGTKGRLLKSTEETVSFVKKLQIHNLKFAFNLAHSIAVGEQPEAALAKYKDDIGGLLLSVPGRDDYGQYFDKHCPLYQSDEQLAELIHTYSKSSMAEGVLDFVCQDALYDNWNEVYLDIKTLKTVDC